MSFICAVGTAVPPYRAGQAEAREFCRALFSGAFPDIDRLVSVFNNGLIETRYFSVPGEWFQTDHSFSEKNRLYIESALGLGKTAIERCLETAGLDPSDIDHFLFISTTGLATPSIDARLINILKMRKDVRRTPIWGLGCAGGAAGLSRAFDYTQAFPDQRVLVLALELCGLTFIRNDMDKSNFIASSLFADGAAAVLVAGEQAGLDGVRILGSRSTLWYDSLDVMGWDVNDLGLKVLFSRDIPAIVREWLKPNLQEFLGMFQIGIGDLCHIVAHPGGAKILEAYQEVLELGDGQLDPAREVLRNYGNMSSPTVLFVLKEFICSGAFRPGEYGLLTALGPGFSSEMLLLQG
ncbi:MAG TPA: 3-oxoacyl-[acyl-carrier-protein] synthase III C-terminal domain-containing protein [Acidobacteriota bacterium]|nr:3-oxoacyl-[acyl-carrier-protein] synthase III C-terminal domain-containing protein [Acidobacteriota bacterium]